VIIDDLARCAQAGAGVALSPACLRLALDTNDLVTFKLAPAGSQHNA